MPIVSDEQLEDRRAVAVRHAMAAWDRQQVYYAPGRDRRWGAVVDALSHRLSPQDIVADLGCGPGSLTRTLADAVPGPVWGIEADPFLHRLAALAWSASNDIRWVCGRFVDDRGRWVADTPSGGFAALVSSTTLHYLDADQLTAFYDSARQVTRPDAVIVTADLLPHSLADVAPNAPTPWLDWWAMVASDPLLGPLLRASDRSDLPSGNHVLTVSQHTECAHAAGWRVRELWREDASAVLVAARG